MELHKVTTRNANPKLQTPRRFFRAHVDAAETLVFVAHHAYKNAAAFCAAVLLYKSLEANT